MGRLALAIALLVGTGCRQLLGFENPAAIGDGSPTDSDPPGDISSELMPVDGCTSFSTVIDTCATTATGPLSITSSATYNTSTFILDIGGVMTTPQHVVFATATGEIDALFATSFTLTAPLRITGSRPIAIVSIDGITIGVTGVLDLSAGGAGARGFGACPGEIGGTGNVDVGGGSGGGGAGYQSGGGAGGDGDSDGGQSTGALGGGSRPRPTSLLGSCLGGAGGAGDGFGGAGGAGAGAILLASGQSITIRGAVVAGGGAGIGGGGDAGGGGGGAGGMIVLESPDVAVTSSGAIAANGGGGGEGGATPQAGGTGAPGNKLGTPAAGGSGIGGGADGGAGSGNLQTTGSSPSAVQTGGGGGGGGAAGYIAIGAGTTMLDGVVSPPAGAWP